MGAWRKQKIAASISVEVVRSVCFHLLLAALLRAKEQGLPSDGCLAFWNNYGKRRHCCPKCNRFLCREGSKSETALLI